MAVAILLYNTFLTSILTLSMACGYYLHIREKRRIFAVLGVMFAAYLVDNTIVYCTESIQSFAEAYDKMFISSPSFKTVYFVVLMACLVYACWNIMRPRSLVPFYVVIGLYAVVLICVPLIPDANLMVFFYYLPTQLLIAGVSIWGLVALRKSSARYQRPFYGTFRKILTWMLVMSILILVEDTIVIFFFDVYSIAGLNINNRSWTENTLFLGLSCFFIKYTVVVLSSTEKNLLGPLHPRTAVDGFSAAYGLTDREHEILKLVLDGKSQQEICDQLVIALGTVKTHIHNVYHKTEVTKRSQLVTKFQQFCQQMASEQTEEDFL